MKIMTALILLFSLSTFASKTDTKKPVQKKQKLTVESKDIVGLAELNVASMGKNIIFLFKTNAKTVFGFDPPALTQEQKQRVKVFKRAWKRYLLKHFIFPKDLKCKIAQSSVKTGKEKGEEKNIAAAIYVTGKAKVSCEKDIYEQTVDVKLFTFFSKLSNIYFEHFKADGDTFTANYKKNFSFKFGTDPAKIVKEKKSKKKSKKKK